MRRRHRRADRDGHRRHRHRDVPGSHRPLHHRHRHLHRHRRLRRRRGSYRRHRHRDGHRGPDGRPDRDAGRRGDRSHRDVHPADEEAYCLVKLRRGGAHRDAGHRRRDPGGGRRGRPADAGPDVRPAPARRTGCCRRAGHAARAWVPGGGPGSEFRPMRPGPPGPPGRARGWQAPAAPPEQRAREPGLREPREPERPGPEAPVRAVPGVPAEPAVPASDRAWGRHRMMPACWAPWLREHRPERISRPRTTHADGVPRVLPPSTTPISRTRPDRSDGRVLPYW